MSRAPLPRVTLACVDCVDPPRAVRAMRISMSHCDFAAAKFFTDESHAASIAESGIDCVPIPPVKSSRDYSRFVMKDLVGHVDTDFVQLVQWDGYVTNGAAWTEEFLGCDYIGARWFFRQTDNVGNGGFSLRSRRLLEALRDPLIDAADPEDEAICVTHRGFLERAYRIRFAPPALADRYAFEGTLRNGNEFGFHRIFNLPFFHGEAELAHLLDGLPEERFATAASVTLVKYLSNLGRRREALRYAQRLRANHVAYASLPQGFRALLDSVH
jgi:hypothetical protein